MKKNRIIVEEKAEKEQYAEEVTAMNEVLKETNEELKETNYKLENANNRLEIANDRLERANNDINASINYASRIQSKVLNNDI